ncbi:unnamed protein product [Larinioides sclopetarius]|uniref:Uncharacterized protein n=1 Tax=Larinioides sclopetarius TaxID=280406 RepID=A0AAV2BSW6_9ARAC
MANWLSICAKYNLVFCFQNGGALNDTLATAGLESSFIEGLVVSETSFSSPFILMHESFFISGAGFNYLTYKFSCLV